MRSLWAVSFFLVAACGPRSSHEVARAFSGLSVAASAPVLSFRDEGSGLSGVQDHFVQVELSLTPTEVTRLFAEARENGYQSIAAAAPPAAMPSPTDTTIAAGLGVMGEVEARAELPPGGQGLYRYHLETPSDSRLVVLDSTRRRLVIRALL